MRLEPNPFHPHPTGAWHDQSFKHVLDGVRDLLARYEDGRVSEHHLLRGKDNGREKRDTLSYWLYYQHHPGSERWKILGQRYWSERAYASFSRRYHATPDAQRRNKRDGGPSLMTIPKRSDSDGDGLVSEHVFPKKVLKTLIMSGQYPLGDILRLNLCAVVTRTEDRLLERDTHPEPFDPWRRYAGTGICFIENPDWQPAERGMLLARDLWKS